MRKNRKLWSYALAGALAVSNLSGVVAAPFTTILAQAAVANGKLFIGKNIDPTASDAIDFGEKHPGDEVSFYIKNGSEASGTDNDAVSVTNPEVEGLTITEVAAADLKAGEQKQITVTVADDCTEGVKTISFIVDGQEVTATLNVTKAVASHHTITFENDGQTTQTIETATETIGSGSAEVFTTPAITATLDGYTATNYKVGTEDAFHKITNSVVETDAIVVNSVVDAGVKYAATKAGTLSINWKADEFSVYTAILDKDAEYGRTYESVDPTFTPKESAPALADPKGGEYAGYDFKGWDVDGNTSTIEAANLSALPAAVDAQHVKNLKAGGDGNVTATAVLDVESYTVTFAAGTGGSGTASDLTYTYDKSLTIPKGYFTKFTKKGYDFKGFAEGAGTEVVYTVEKNVIPAKKYADNVTLTAIYEAGKVVVSFDANADDATGIMADQEMEADKATALSENKFKRTGYTFDKWNTQADGKGESKSDKEEVSLVEATTYFAQWKENTYTIAFDPNGGSGTTAPKANVKYSEDVELTPNGFSLAGYEFIGWSTNPNDTEPEVLDKATVSKLTAEDKGQVTYYAVWESNGKTTVKYDGNGAKGTMSIVRDAPLPYPVVDNGFTVPEHRSFLGWSTDKDATEPEYIYGDAKKGQILKGAPANLTLYAIWQGEKHTVDFVGNADGVTGDMDTQTFEYGKEQALTPNAFVYSEHNFAGWSLTPSGEVKYSDEAKIKDLDTNVVLYAQWTPIAEEATKEVKEATDNLNKAITNADTATKAANGATGAANKAADAVENDPTEDNIAAAKAAEETATKAASDATAAANAVDTALDNLNKVLEETKTEAVDQKAIAEAEAAKTAAETAASAANTAASNATTAASAAKDAADTAQEKMSKDEAIAKANAAADKAVNDPTDANIQAAKDAVKAAESTKGVEAADLEPANSKIAQAEAANKAAKDKMSKDEAIEAANTAAEKAVNDPTDANIQAAKDAIASAEAKGATSDDLKDAKANLAKAEEAAKKNEKAADGSAAGAPAAEGTELVDANGNKTGFKVTDASASNPEVEYEGPADKNATKADIPETYTDLSGNTYKVTGIVANAFKDTKVKTVTIRKNIKKIDPKAFNKSKVKNVKIKGIKLTKKMAKSFKKLKKGGWIKVSGKHKAKNKEILNNLSNVKNGKTKVK